MAQGGSARARAEELWARAAAEREKEEAARALAESFEAQAGAWDAGAEGERRVAEALHRLPQGWHVVHDRLLSPGTSQVNLDHIVIGPAGVFLVDAKNWAGGTSVYGDNLFQHAGGSASKGSELDKLSRVAGEMEKALGAPVVPIIALAGGHGSKFRAQRVRGVEVVPFGRLVKWLRAQPTATDSMAVDLMARKVAHTYPPASPDTVDPALTPTSGLTVRAVVDSRRRAGVRTSRPHGRPSGRSRKRQTSVARLVVALLLLLGLGHFGPQVIPAVLEKTVPHSFGLLAPSREQPQAKPCQLLTRATISRATGAGTVLEKPRGDDGLCTWWLGKPRYASDSTDLTLEMGSLVRARFAASGTTDPRIDMLPGEVSAWLPQGTSLRGWTSKSRATQPFMISLRFSYPTGASDRQRRVAEAAAERKVTRLAEEFARSLTARAAAGPPA